MDIEVSQQCADSQANRYSLMPTMSVIAQIPDLREELDRQGFFIAPDGLAHTEVVQLISAVEKASLREAEFIRRRRGSAYAVRNLLSTIPALGSVIDHSLIQALLQRCLSDGALITRSILFDKNPDANWSVPWHQDTTIAVQSRIETAGFGPWSVKAGVVHVQPPAHVLESMLTVRVHLDDCDADNGALIVLPGSHRRGILEPAQIAEFRRTTAPVVCELPAGGVLLMKPLLLHASSAAIKTSHRRVVHLEFAGGGLPNGLEWNDADAA